MNACAPSPPLEHDCYYPTRWQGPQVVQLRPSCALSACVLKFDRHRSIPIGEEESHQATMVFTLSIRAVTSAMLVTGTSFKSYTPSSTTRLRAEGGHRGGTACTSTSNKAL